MDIEELKKAWNNQNIQIAKLEEQNNKLRQQISHSRLSTNRSKLLRTYLVMVIVAAVMVPIIPFAFTSLNVSNLTSIAFTVLMGIMAIVNFYVYCLIKEIDITNCSVKDALTNTIRLERLRQRIRVATMVISLPVLIIFFTELFTNDEMPGLWGGIIGGIFGGILGLKKEFEIRRMIGQMRHDLEYILTDPAPSEQA